MKKPWEHPSKHLLVFKTSWKRFQKMHWRCLQHVFSVTIFRLPRRLQDVLEDEKLLRWRRLQKVLKTCLEDVLKTCLEEVFRTSWRQAECLLGISVSNKSKFESNKSIFSKSISGKSQANPKCINQNPIISILSLFWNTSSISILWVNISEIEHWPSETIKTKF